MVAVCKEIIGQNNMIAFRDAVAGLVRRLSLC
jgi:hypothetical protein